jgi:hypothetical protein
VRAYVDAQGAAEHARKSAAKASPLDPLLASRLCLWVRRRTARPRRRWECAGNSSKPVRPTLPETRFVVVSIFLGVLEVDHQKAHMGKSERAVYEFEKRFELAIRKIVAIEWQIDVNRPTIASHHPFACDFSAEIPAVTVVVQSCNDRRSRRMRFPVVRRTLARRVIVKGDKQRIALLSTRDGIDMLDHVGHGCAV